MSHHSDDLALCRALAGEAAAILREGHGRAQPIELKGPVDLVTEYDRRVEALIVRRLRAADPQARIVGEEGGAQGSAGAERVWYVDPLDGTTNFAHGLPIFSVSIALYVAGEPRCGLVHAPALGWEFAASRGGGATLNGDAIRVSATATLDGALLVTGFPYDRRTTSELNLDNFGAFVRRTQGVRRLGSAALDLCFVARGWLDGYWERKLHPWDVAAGALIAAEAGARLTDLAGGPPHVEQGEIVASNGRIHDAMLAVLADVRAGRAE
ncbi:MAG TPA: inositol monophosphatase family protein [Polyangia bacterium]|jgi:myo-inositol-1(or 4)-monophosphatase